MKFKPYIMKKAEDCVVWDGGFVFHISLVLNYKINHKVND